MTFCLRKRYNRWLMASGLGLPLPQVSVCWLWFLSMNCELNSGWTRGENRVKTSFCSNFLLYFDLNFQQNALKYIFSYVFMHVFGLWTLYSLWVRFDACDFRLDNHDGYDLLGLLYDYLDGGLYGGKKSLCGQNWAFLVEQAPTKRTAILRWSSHNEYMRAPRVQFPPHHHFYIAYFIGEYLLNSM